MMVEENVLGYFCPVEACQSLLSTAVYGRYTLRRRVRANANNHFRKVHPEIGPYDAACLVDRLLDGLEARGAF